MQEKFLVIGGTGKTGRKVVEQLNAQGKEVRIGSRSAAIPFDWSKPEAWPAVLEGIDKMYVTFQPDLAVPGAKEAITTLTQKAIQSGVKKMVLLSGKGEEEAQLCEQIVINSGLDYTIIRASWFNQNFSETFFLNSILAGNVALPKAEAQVPYVDTDDIAAVAVQTLLDDAHNGQTYELTGPRLLTFPEIVTEIAQASGRALEFTPISLDQYLEILKGAGVPEDHIWLINYLFSNVLDTEGNNIISNDIEKVLGRKAKDFSDYVKETAATGVWSQELPVEASA